MEFESISSFSFNWIVTIDSKNAETILSPSVSYKNKQIFIELSRSSKNEIMIFIRSEPELKGISEIKCLLLNNCELTIMDTRELDYAIRRKELFRLNWLEFTRLLKDTTDPDNVFKIHCSIEFRRNLKVLDYETYHCDENDSSLEKLSSDLRKLLDTGEQSDIVLNCCNQKFPLHKNILSARSEVYSAMFRNDLSETKEGVVNITDIQAPILELLLQYMYSGKIDGLTIDNALDVYAAADKYTVESLKEKCASFIRSKITVESVGDILYFSDLYNDQDMKVAVKLFIRNNKRTLQTQQWKEFSKKHPLLAVEIYEDFF